MLSRVEGHDPVDARLHLVPTCETQRVADIDDGAAILGLDKSELASPRRADLESPLLAEEQGQRADVGMLLVADVLVDRIAWNVVHHGQGGGRRPVIAVSILESCSARESESRGQRRQNGLRDDVAARNGILQDLDIRAVLDYVGQMGAGLLDFVSSNLLVTPDISPPRQSSNNCIVQHLERPTLIISYPSLVSLKTPVREPTGS